MSPASRDAAYMQIFFTSAPPVLLRLPAVVNCSRGKLISTVSAAKHEEDLWPHQRPGTRRILLHVNPGNCSESTDYPLSRFVEAEANDLVSTRKYPNRRYFSFARKTIRLVCVASSTCVCILFHRRRNVRNCTECSILIYKRNYSPRLFVI